MGREEGLEVEVGGGALTLTGLPYLSFTTTPFFSFSPVALGFILTSPPVDERKNAPASTPIDRAKAERQEDKCFTQGSFREGPSVGRGRTWPPPTLSRAWVLSSCTACCVSLCVSVCISLPAHTSSASGLTIDTSLTVAPPLLGRNTPKLTPG